jgi:phosphoglycolate phosphatase-like HAD superfamily hydrolase
MLVPGSKPAAVIFDCDGVLLISNRMKIRVFCSASHEAGFSEEHVTAFRRHVAGNFGTSRRRLFEWLVQTAGAPREGVDVESLVQGYASGLYSAYVRCPTTPGMLGVLDRIRDAGIPMFIVSGSDQTELRSVMKEKGLDGYFVDILGSPTGKPAHIEAIAERLGIDEAARGSLMFVGDAEADLRAADATGTRFVYMDHYSTAKPGMRAHWAGRGFERIRDLRELPALIPDMADA